MEKICLVWFRRDLRLNDNPALREACQRGLPILCLYILEDDADGLRPLGGASLWWLDQSLRRLDEDLQELGGRLLLQRANKDGVLANFEQLTKTYDIEAVFWNRRYGADERSLDTQIKKWLSDHDIEAHSYNGNLLMEPWEVCTDAGAPYKVFTPFWRALKDRYQGTPEGKLPSAQFLNASGDTLDHWGLHPTKPDWSTGMAETWTPGETGALNRLNDFLDEELAGYPQNRDRPDLPATSRLSPYLAFGEISPKRIWHATLAKMASHPDLESDGWAFLREIAWREFSFSLLYQSENLAQSNWNVRFDHFSWASTPEKLRAWQSGQTGYPIVDAGLRELWHTGWMHNRVRMIVASFLTKHLLQDWRNGEKWFWDTLVDADPANNPASWQWVAGSGADAAPYFRIFNPMTQGEKFDPQGKYIRKWVPELAKLPDRYLNTPWEAPSAVLTDACIRLGETYPKPIVDHRKARERALAAYEETKHQGTAS